MEGKVTIQSSPSQRLSDRQRANLCWASLPKGNIQAGANIIFAISTNHTHRGPIKEGRKNKQVKSLSQTKRDRAARNRASVKKHAASQLICQKVRTDSRKSQLTETGEVCCSSQDKDRFCSLIDYKKSCSSK
jgi:hypothetical protein